MGGFERENKAFLSQLSMDVVILDNPALLFVDKLTLWIIVPGPSFSFLQFLL